MKKLKQLFEAVRTARRYVSGEKKCLSHVSEEAYELSRIHDVLSEYANKWFFFLFKKDYKFVHKLVMYNYHTEEYYAGCL